MDEQMNPRRKTTGRTSHLGITAAVMRALSDHLWVADKKFRVAIECGPKEDRFIITREEVVEKAGQQKEGKPNA